MKSHEITCLVNALRDVAICYRDHQSLREKIAKVLEVYLDFERSLENGLLVKWLEKTEWVQDEKDWPFPVLGDHRGDVIKRYVDYLESELAKCQSYEPNADKVLIEKVICEIADRTRKGETIIYADNKRGRG